MSEKIRSYAVLRNRILEKMRTRDPLFKAAALGVQRHVVVEFQGKNCVEVGTPEFPKRWWRLVLQAFKVGMPGTYYAPTDLDISNVKRCTSRVDYDNPEHIGRYN